MHEIQNRMQITFCAKPPLPSILLEDKGVLREIFGRGLSWPSAGTGVVYTICILHLSAFAYSDAFLCCVTPVWILVAKN